MDQGITPALQLGQEHIGLEVSYGPGMMFSGVIVEAQLRAGNWLEGDDLMAHPAPPRMFLRMQDGSAATLGASALVHLRAAEQEGEI